MLPAVFGQIVNSKYSITMNSKLLLTSICMLVAIASHGQFLISGTVVNKSDNSSVAFANIGIINSSVGTCG